MLYNNDQSRFLLLLNFLLLLFRGDTDTFFWTPFPKNFINEIL